MQFEEKLEEYAKLVVNVGINVQLGQVVVIRTPIEGAYFARKMCQYAYESGAKKVYIEYSDEVITRMTYEYATEETLSEFPKWETIKYEELVASNAAFISISAADPSLLKGINPSKIAATQKASGKGLVTFRKAVSNSEVCWCVVSIPIDSWSIKVFPECKDAREANERLWEEIFKVSRIGKGNAVKAWKEHIDKITQRCKYLNEKHIKYLEYTARGTDLKVELPKEHIWEGGGEYSTKGTYFVANMPTEEIFTMPYKYGVNGTLQSTKPLVYGGHLIDDFNLKFKDGKIIEFSAKEGEELLKKLIETDEGAAYLGEVAIVPHSSPISKTGLLFYNTLFDENASCHFAIGSSYPTNIKGGVNMTDEELESKGANTSITHNDFMIGSQCLDIKATTETGEQFYILKAGEWAFEV